MAQSARANGLSQFWRGLPTWGQLLVVALPLVVLAGITTAIVGLTGHSESWEYGHQHSDSAASFVTKGFSEQSACRSIAGIGTGHDNSTLDYGDVMDGCLAGLRGG